MEFNIRDLFPQTSVYTAPVDDTNQTDSGTQLIPDIPEEQTQQSINQLIDSVYQPIRAILRNGTVNELMDHCEKIDISIEIVSTVARFEFIADRLPESNFKVLDSSTEDLSFLMELGLHQKNFDVIRYCVLNCNKSEITDSLLDTFGRLVDMMDDDDEFSKIEEILDSVDEINLDGSTESSDEDSDDESSDDSENKARYPTYKWRVAILQHNTNHDLDTWFDHTD